MDNPVYKYNRIVELINQRVASGTLKIGDKLPSIRQLSVLTGYSMVTVHHGYELLESEGICTARPRSGFYLSKLPPTFDEFPTTSPEGDGEPVAVSYLPEALLLAWRRKGVEAFGAFYPCSDLFSRQDIDKVLRRILRNGAARYPGSEAPEGDPLLRQQIAIRAAKKGIFVRQQDILVTGSAMQGCGLCLDGLTEPGDVVLIEAPSYFPMLSAVKRRNLRVVELYSHPVTGVDPEHFEYLLNHNPIKVALLMANHHYPTGLTYSDDTMQRLVASASAHGVTIVENDMLGDLGFGSGAPSSLKQFDRDDTVVQFSSFEHSLPSAYGIGWVIAGKKVRKLQAAQYLSGYTTQDGLVQRAVAEYLANRSLDRQLRQIRENLSDRMRRGIEIIAETFPHGCSVSRPEGGYMCWLRVPGGTDAQAAASLAVKRNFSVLPGPIFSVEGGFRNFFALNFSFPWTPQNERALATLGAMVKKT